MKDIEGYVVSASDGEIGKVADFLLDDSWTSRDRRSRIARVEC